MNIWFEMITCRVDTEQVVPFPRSERLQTRSIFSDMNFKYDEDFWKDLNTSLNNLKTDYIGRRTE